MDFTGEADGEQQQQDTPQSSHAWLSAKVVTDLLVAVKYVSIPQKYNVSETEV